MIDDSVKSITIDDHWKILKVSTRIVWPMVYKHADVLMDSMTVIALRRNGVPFFVDPQIWLTAWWLWWAENL